MNCSLILFSKALPLIAQSRGYLSDHLGAPSFHCLPLPPPETHGSCGSEGVALWCELRAGASGHPRVMGRLQVS